MLATLRDLYVLHACRSTDGRCLVPAVSHDGVGRRFQLPNASWAAVKAWTAQHTRPFKRSISADGKMVGALVGGAEYGGVQTRLTSNTAWLDDPACAPVYAAVWQLKRFVMGPRLVAPAARRGGGDVHGAQAAVEPARGDAGGRRWMLLGSGEVRSGRVGPGVPAAGTALRRQVVDDDVLSIQDVSVLDVPPAFAVDVRVWQLVLHLFLEFEGPGSDDHVARSLADVTAAAGGDVSSFASASARAAAARAGHGRHGRPRWFDRDGSQLVGALLYWLGDKVDVDAASRGSRFAASLPSLTPFQVVLWLGVVRQSVLLPRWRRVRGASASSRAPVAQQLQDAAACAAVARGVVRDIAAGWDALALTVGYADVEAMLGRYMLFVSEPPCWADLCRPTDVFTFAPSLQDVCLLHGMPAARVVPVVATAARAVDADEPGCTPGLAATAAATAHGDLQLRTCGAHFLDHVRRCTSPAAIELLLAWARAADPPASGSSLPADASGSGDVVVGARRTTGRQRPLGCTPTSSSTLTGLDYRPPIWSGRWCDAPPRILRAVARGMTAFPAVDVAGSADAQLRTAGRRGGRHSRRHGQPVGDERVGRRTRRDESSSSSSSSSSRRSGSVGGTSSQSSSKDENLSDGGSEETRSDLDAAADNSSWQPRGEHLRPYTRAEKSAFERRTQFRLLSATIVWVDAAAAAGRGSSARTDRHHGGGVSSIVDDTQGAGDVVVGGRGGGRPGDALTLVDRAMCLVAQAHVCSFEQLRSTYGMANGGGGVGPFAVGDGLFATLGHPSGAGIAAALADGTRPEHYLIDDAGGSSGGGKLDGAGGDRGRAAGHTLPRTLVGTVQMILIDPPYNTRRLNNMTTSEHDELSDRDMDLVVEEAGKMLRPGGNIHVFCAPAQLQPWIDKLRWAVEGGSRSLSGTSSRPGDSVDGGGGAGGRGVRGGRGSTSGSSARGALGKRKSPAVRSSPGAAVFHVDSAPVYLVKDPRSFTSLRGGSTALKNKVEMVVRATRSGLRREDEYDMVNYRNFSMVPSRFRAHENVIDNVRGPTFHEAVRDAPDGGGGPGKWVRPEQKGRGLLQELILRNSQPGDTIVDFFAGTLSTAMACVSMPMGQHRLVVCGERDPRVVELAFSRLRAEFVHAVTLGGFARCGRTDVVVRACEDLRRQADALEKEHQAGSSSVGPPCLGHRLATAAELGWAPPAVEKRLPCHSALPPELVAFLACRWAGGGDASRALFGAGHPLASTSGAELATRVLALKGVGVGRWPVEFQRRLAVEDAVTLRDVCASRLELYTALSGQGGGTCGLGVFAGRSIRAGERVAPFFGTIVYANPSTQTVKSVRYASDVLGAHGPTTRDVASRAVEVEVLVARDGDGDDDRVNDGADGPPSTSVEPRSKRTDPAIVQSGGARLRARPERAAASSDDAAAGMRSRSVWVVPAPYCVGGYVNDPRPSSLADEVQALATTAGAQTPNAKLCVMDMSGRPQLTELLDFDALHISAIKDIRVGEEVLVDYGTQYDFSRDRKERERGTRSTPHTFFPLRQ